MSVLAREAAETPACAARQIATVGDVLEEAVRRLRARPPSFVVTCARGSSDHAATYGKYLIESTPGLGLPVASVGPSIVSTYGATPKLDGALFLAISQSGKSPDLIELTRAARAGGALVIGVINDTASPLATACDLVIPHCAGEETAVAATKSFLCSCLALLQLVARWSAASGGSDQASASAVAAAPDALAAAAKLDWSLQQLASAHSAYVLGRGVGLSAALEIALKLKEVCGLHAEAFSTAELKHGPLALVGPGFPIVAFSQRDRTEPSVRDALAELATLGADIATTLPLAGTRALESPDVPAVLAPLCHVLACYLALPALARARGLNPDRPRHLSKVTRTI